jgi:hypothetical protein
VENTGNVFKILVKDGFREIGKDGGGDDINVTNEGR